MLRFQTVLWFLFLTIYGYSQTTYSLDFISGAEFTYRNLSTTSEKQSVLETLSRRERVENGKFIFTGGFNFGLRKRLGKN